MKVWITKYALSCGIIEADARPISEDPRWVYVMHKWGHNSYKIGRDAFLAPEGAEIDFGVRQEKKIKALRKQIDKIQKATASVVHAAAVWEGYIPYVEPDGGQA